MNIKDEIYKNGYTIKSFADKVKIDKSTVFRIINENRARGDVIARIAKGLGLTYEEAKEMIEKGK